MGPFRIATPLQLPACMNAVLLRLGDVTNPSTKMKTLLAITAIALTGLALPQAAEASHPSSSLNLTYVSGHSSCGCPIYTQRIFIGYDSWNRPVYRYVSVPVRHRCSHLSLGGGFLHLGGSHHSDSHRTSIHWGGLYLGDTHHGGHHESPTVGTMAAITAATDPGPQMEFPSH
jgi:hypothetical protein